MTSLKSVVIALDTSPAAASVLQFALDNIRSDALHLVHCYKPLPHDASVRPHYAIVLAGAHTRVLREGVR